ncbi:MAG: hypothetical protein H0W02_06145 [Ktedonobacteraceae bacterium]|nr:hypothetical protein [Ktedonobacteraceae bacterium]
MNTLVSLLVCVAAIAIIALIVWRPGKKAATASYAAPPSREERFAELDARLVRRDELQNLLQAQQKIQAIKLYREDTGASLREAKLIIDRMAATNAVAVHSTFAEPGSHELTSQFTTEIQDCLRVGHKIEAIKIYREQTGVSLKEAKNAVERMEAEMR